ncbi:MAG: 50S ribosomal protein L13 [Candidatus Andersenbacteria bacterium CG10_big_fil_rev_8_21_14_0_10_54_11]|uniref:Large ribosomal subunit protein uL13 n=1 Tax=Candidatus Andersenbacteria bacterium CG10_big_fil_rev_8_21_14_0_10_54_11 TaxID=1974485 RepID=A0A2M6WYG2_9BACT|nr:MAG: 50S ribosomal protein L13 [Candidatus Andersenbacteria bacterium CG10_big_fil_rev_8_21_14_0_10_54_11]
MNRTPRTRTSASSEAEWHVLNADGRILGRLANEAAQLLLGKHRTDARPHTVCPVYVVVTHTDRVAVTGSKETEKTYYRHTGYPGGLKQRTLAEQRRRDSRRIVLDAVAGMLPKNNLRQLRLGHLKLYRGSEHPHAAQVGTTA